ncbi:30S ribosomal protein S24e [Methanocaldococcus lauensis]|nr:30S ribosomal protein S24e [Methanocaldococcus lauensis]
MEIRILSERYNPLLKRKEYRFIVDYEGATPTFKDVKLKLAAILNANKDLLIVEKIVGESGMQRVRGYAKLYDNEEMLKLIEREHILRKNKIDEEEETTAEGGE